MGVRLPLPAPTKSTPTGVLFVFRRNSYTPIMKTIYLIRHGHVDNPEHVFYDEHFPLSETGAKEATKLGKALKTASCEPSRIISSPYLRTRETAHIISSEIEGPEVEYDDRLKEWQVGNWFLKPLAEFRKHTSYDKTPFHPNTDGIEDIDSMAKRVRSAIQDTALSMQDDTCAALVSHREPLVSAILSLQGKNWEEVPILDFPKGSSWKLDFDEENNFLSAKKAFDCASDASKKGV